MIILNQSSISKVFLGLLLICLSICTVQSVNQEALEGRMLLSEKDINNKINGENCRAGCLICSSKDMCLLCDLSGFYLSHGYYCKQKKLENCVKTNDGVNCLFCKTKYFLGQFILLSADWGLTIRSI